MKTSVITIVLALLIANLVAAAEKIEAGPKGGRLLGTTEPRAEFVVGKDHTVTINFYDAKLKPVPAAQQTATVIAQTKDGRQTVEFEKKGDSLVSKSKLPEGDGYNVVVQLKEKPDSKPQNHRFKLDLSTCSGCKLGEYACTCHD